MQGSGKLPALGNVFPALGRLAVMAVNIDVEKAVLVTQRKISGNFGQQDVADVPAEFLPVFPAETRRQPGVLYVGKAKQQNRFRTGVADGAFIIRNDKQIGRYFEQKPFLFHLIRHYYIKALNKILPTSGASLKYQSSYRKALLLI